jgi:transposase-like protein
MSQRDIEDSLASALGQFVLSKSTVSELSDRLRQEYEAWRTRELSRDPLAYLFIEPGYEPLRRWGQKTGVRCVWAIGENGRKVLRSLATTNSERDERCLEVWRGWVKRGKQTPVTMTTDGAVGLPTALAAVWPKSKRRRCWFPKRQNLPQKVPP